MRVTSVKDQAIVALYAITLNEGKESMAHDDQANTHGLVNLIVLQVQVSSTQNSTTN